MKKYIEFSLTLLLVFGLLACEKQSSEEPSFAGFQIRMDTVMVDAGEDFIHLNGSLLTADLEPSERYLYNYDEQGHNIEVIDLDELKLDRKIPLQKEGPDGITFIRDLLHINDSTFLLRGRTSDLYNGEGKKNRALKLNEITNFESTMWGLFMMDVLDVPNDENRYISFYKHSENQKYFLVDYDVTEMSYQKIELPTYDELNNFFTKVTVDGKIAMTAGCGTDMTFGDNRLIISNGCYNFAYVFDLATDALSLKKWESQLYDKNNRYQPPKQVTYNTDEYYEMGKLRSQEIRFGRWRWDATHKRHYRFSYINRMSEERNEWGNYKVIDAQVFLTVLDAGFNLISEMEIPEFTQRPKNYFVKDGMIWVFENINDDLAFIRMELVEEN